MDSTLLTNAKGVEVHVHPLGAMIQRLLLPDKNGAKDDVVLGFEETKPYLDGTSPYFGVVVGRVANRIADSTFAVDGETFKVTPNENGHCLHGGVKGFDKAFWKVKDSSSASQSITLTHSSPDGDQGFPGQLDAQVKYTLLDGDATEDGVLVVEMTATANKPTPVSLAQHSYFNLAGHNKGSDVLGHELRLNAPSYTPVNDTLIPTGQLAPVVGTPFDFCQGGSADMHTVGERIKQVPGGYDHNFALDTSLPVASPWCSPPTGHTFHEAATLRDPTSRRCMRLLATTPGVQFYSGNFLDGSITTGKGGATYHKHGGLALETQGFPNAVNEPSFPNNLLRPGETYFHGMVYVFSRY